MASPLIRHLEILYRRMCEAGATFIEFQIGSREKIRLVRRLPAHVKESLAAPGQVTTVAQPSTEDRFAGAFKVMAPLSGVFYRAPAPSAPSFVEEGAVVKKGVVLCIIEAMKVLNEIKAPREGKIVSIAAINGKHVKKGDILFVYGD